MVRTSIGGWASSHCYIAYVDGKPGLLLMAEYDEDYCKGQGIPNDYDGKYDALSARCNRLEKLMQAVNGSSEVGIGVDTGFDLELILFIPTEAVSAMDVLRLYYLMGEYAYSMPPDDTVLETDRLCDLAKRCLPPSNLHDELMMALEKAPAKQEI